MGDYALVGTFGVGRTTVHHVSDGVGFGPRRSWFHNVDPATWTQALGLTDPETPFALNYGIFVIESPSGITLVDSGFGAEVNRWTGIRGGGQLLDRLAELGIAPADVKHIIQTHLHPDHCGQLVTETSDGPVLTFPNATVHLHAAELAHWTGTGSDEDPLAPFVRARIAVVLAAGTVSTFASTTAVAPGVVTLPVGGHTPGHTCVLVADEGECCLLVGDLVHHPIHFERPDWLHELDTDPRSSVKAREAISELAIGLGAVVTAPHMPVLTLGRLSRDAAGRVRWSRVEAVHKSGCGEAVTPPP